MVAAPYRLGPARADRRLSERFFGRFRRVGLRGVLADLDCRATPAQVPGDGAAEGFTWEERDATTDRWWPQGVTTSADAYGPDPQSGTYAGRPVLLASWYAHGVLGWLTLGSRVSVVDLTDPADPRYRHVLLVEPRRRFGLHRLRPVRVHAGGIVWYGDHLFVAGSSRGIRVFRVDDVVRVRNRWRTRGDRYVLPQLTTYHASTTGAARPITYSFLSLDRAGDVDHLVAGEYGRKGATHRLLRYELDRTTQLLRGVEAGPAEPVEAHDGVAPRMQGAVLVDGTWVITASAGEDVAGDLWVGRPGALHRHRGVLPTGPEDITWWPQRGQLWTLTEWPGRRWVYGIDVDRWVRPAPPA